MEIILIALGSLVFGFLLATSFLYPFLRARFEARFDAQVSESVRQRFDEWIAKNREQIVQETLRRSSATIKGQIGERFAPLVPDFGYEPADARFLGSPVDYIVFDGLSKEQIKGIAFVEVKTGAGKLTPYQRQVREAIEAGRVTWRLLQMPELVVERELDKDA